MNLGQIKLYIIFKFVYFTFMGNFDSHGSLVPTIFWEVMIPITELPSYVTCDYNKVTIMDDLVTACLKLLYKKSYHVT